MKQHRCTFPHFVHDLYFAPCSLCGGFSGGETVPPSRRTALPLDVFFSHQRHEEGEPQLGMSQIAPLLPSDGTLVLPPPQTDTRDESCGGDKAGGVANETFPPCGDVGGECPGTPAGISLLLTSLTGSSSSFLQHSSRLPCSMPQSSANGVHVTTMCQTNLGQPPHSLHRALGILWNGEYSNAFLGETAGFQAPKYYDLS